MKILLALLLSGLQLAAQDMQSCPMHKDQMKAEPQRQADIEKRGDEGMEFAHGSTTHRFRLSPDGGAIEVTVFDSTDTQTLQTVRSHLTHIVTMFSNGDFSIPMFVHSQVPPGVTEMKEKRAEISYSVTELPNGAAIRIKTDNHDALNAIQDFLRFQIQDHGTGDKTE